MESSGKTSCNFKRGKKNQGGKGSEMHFFLPSCTHIPFLDLFLISFLRFCDACTSNAMQLSKAWEKSLTTETKLSLALVLTRVLNVILQMKALNLMEMGRY